MCYNHHLLVRCLHRWEGKHGDLVLLPPVFSVDPTLPILLPVGYIGELWLNDIFNTPVPAGGTRLGKAHPTISRLSCCCQEVIAGKTLADWMESERVVYPSPPIAPTPKDGETDESDNNSNDEPADDDKKGEQCGGSGEDATPNKKEDQKSEGESDDQSKVPKDPMAVSGDSGLGTSSLGDGVGTGAGATVGALASNPSINPSTGLPLPTQLLSMDHLEKLADDLCAYSRELFQGLEETSMAMLDRVLSGFKRSGGRTREYIYETAAIAINFFSRARDMEAELESSEALKFQEAINGMKESIRDLIR